MIKIKDYEINWSVKQARWTCTCPDFKFRRSRTRNEICKHIFQAIEEGKLKTQVKDKRYKPRIHFEKKAEMIKEMCEEFQFEICGSYRRRAPFLKDLDVLVLIQTENKRKTLIENIELVGRIESGGDKRLTCMFDGIQIDFRIVNDPETWGSMLCHFTGSKTENIKLRQKAKKMGMQLNEYGLTKDDQKIAGKTEEGIYKALGEPYREPWQRS